MIPVDLQPAFEEFVTRSSPRLLRIAFLLVGDRGHAEDMLQVTLLRTARRWRHARGNPDAFARRVLVNLAKDRRRAFRRRVSEARLFPEVGTPVDGPGDQIAQRTSLMWAVGQLPAGQRAILVLRYFEDLSVAATAAALGCSAGNVKAQSHRALTTLRRLLAPELSETHKETNHA